MHLVNTFLKCKLGKQWFVRQHTLEENVRTTLSDTKISLTKLSSVCHSAIQVSGGSLLFLNGDIVSLDYDQS